eukprot:TRINITY_DN12522_c0_g1_i1.p1 TRINITY_DN12522_c0_g1~~TRINITY_DN12522_c0_g1_i1.p1  ORF type:complete len:431 (+),score=87.31 TRINITY_DN12522_c0_g1_i1:9-1301(+)
MESPFPSEDTYLESLEDWCSSRYPINRLEIKTVKLEDDVAEFGEKFWRCVVAKEDLKRGDIVLEIPCEWILGSPKSYDTRISPLVKQFEVPIHPEIELLLFLLSEKLDKSSIWTSYFNSAPKQFESSVFWSDDQLELLVGSQAKKLTQIQKDANEKVWETIVKPFVNKHPDYFPVEESELYSQYIWMVHCLISRSFDLGDDFPGGGLVPYADMMNCTDTPNGDYSFNKEKNCFIIKCNRPVKKGEEFTICYGERNNAVLLVNYGFIIPKYRYNLLEFILPDEIQEYHRYVEKEQHMENIGLKNRKTFELGGLTIELILVLRILMADDNEFDLFKKQYHTAPLSPQSEALAMNLVIRHCDQLLSTYKLSYEEDKRLLKGDLEPRQKQAICLCHEEKKMLRHLKECAQEKLESIANWTLSSDYRILEDQKTS